MTPVRQERSFADERRMAAFDPNRKFDLPPLGGKRSIAANSVKLTLAGFSGLSAKAQHCFGARRTRPVPICKPRRGASQLLKALTAAAEWYLICVFFSIA